MGTSRVTIKDLAKKMNLSFSTISRALQDNPRISEETRKKVKDMAKELGYSRNSVASNLRSKKTHSIGIIVPKIEIHFHSNAISGIEEFASKEGYNVTIYQSRDSYDKEKAITKILKTNMVDGVIACLGFETKNFDHYDKFKSINVPVVFFDRVSKDHDANKVIIDDYKAAFEATEHLITIGCKRIAHVAGCQTTSIFKARLEGYKAALKKYKFDIEEALIEYTKDLSYEEGVNSANRFLSQKNRPDGIFCANDYTAVSSLQVFMKANYNVPEDIAIVGFSNYPISNIIEPKLTTIDDRAFEMGQMAAKLLIRQIEEKDKNIASETIVIKTNLIVRESTKRRLS